MESYSILMTIFKKDNPDFVIQSIDSMLRQTVPTDDFVLVCDGPLTEELNTIVYKYETAHAQIFHVFRLEKNVGLGAALRYGLKQCKNRLVARMDDDDIACLNRCEKELRYLEAHPQISILGTYVNEFECGVEHIIRQKKVPTEINEILAFSKRRNPFNHSTVMFDKEKIIAIGNYSIMRTNQDVELWVRALNNGLLGANLPEALVYFRFERNTYQRRKDLRNVHLMIKVWRKFYKNGYCGLSDLLWVIIMQYGAFFAPIKLVRWVYDHFR